MPRAPSAAGLVVLIAPVAFTSSSPVGILRVTSSVSRSDSCARSCASECSRASSFSCARSCSITPCIEAAMKADGFSVSGFGFAQSFGDRDGFPRKKFRRSTVEASTAAPTMTSVTTTIPAPREGMVGKCVGIDAIM